MAVQTNSLENNNLFDRLTLDIHGYLWISMCGSPWITMGTHRVFLDIHRYPWISMDIMISIDIHGYVWVSMDIHRYPRISMDIHRYP